MSTTQHDPKTDPRPTQHQPNTNPTTTQQTPHQTQDKHNTSLTTDLERHHWGCRRDRRPLARYRVPLHSTRQQQPLHPLQLIRRAKHQVSHMGYEGAVTLAQVPAHTAKNTAQGREETFRMGAHVEMGWTRRKGPCKARRTTSTACTEVGAKRLRFTVLDPRPSLTRTQVPGR